MNIVLMAGGGGTRLWPLSRQKNPKQFLDLGSGQTLLELAYDRAKAVAGADNVYVATVKDYQARIQELLPAIPAEHFFLEPERRSTTAAFATVALRLAALAQGEEPTLFMWCDHIFTNEQEFLADLGKIPAIVAQQPDALVLLGHVPTSPETGLGYFQVGEKLPGFGDAWWVKGFKEKPDLATAEQFVAAGTYFWNLGYFSLRPAYFLEELRRCTPDLTVAIDGFASALTKKSEEAIRAAYHAFPEIAIEFTLLEKTPRIIAVTGDYGWSDVGNWATVQQIFGVAGDHMPAGHHVHVDSQDNYVYNTTSKAVSLIGLKDTIVVVTDDAVLVTAKNKAHKIKDVVAKLEAEGKHQYL